jgi:general secretion pathway protein D
MNRVTQCACLAAASLSIAACSRVFAADIASPARGASAPPTTRAATGPTTLATKISINFKDAPLDTVIEFLSQTVGFAIVKEGALEGRVTIVSKQPVSPEEALTLVNAGLKVNGFTAIRDGRVLRIAARDKAKKGNIPVHFGGKPEDVEDSEELITQVIPIQNVSATKLREDLKPMIGNDADVTANEGSNTIIITDSSSSIRRIVKIISNLDQHEATTAEIRIVQLKYANAAAAVKLIDTFFKNQGGAQMSQEMMMRMQQSGQPMPQQHGGSEKHGNNVIAAADDRTNTLVVMGSTASLKLIDDIIKHLDSNPIPASEMKTYQLKFAQAEATAKLINNLFKPPKSNNDDYPFFYRRFNGDEEAKKNVTVTAAFDERTNSLIITAPADALKGVEEMIKKLDASPMASADLKVFQLKYADAFLTSKVIEDMFKPKDDSGPRFPFYIFGDNPNPQAKGVKVNVTSDDRTNSLIVSAPTELLKIIEDMVKKLDSNPGSEDSLFIYHLRNAQAANLESVLNILFGNVNGQGPGGGQQNGQPGFPGGADQQQQGSRSGSRFGSNSSSGGNGSSVLERNGSSRRSNGLNRPGMPRLSPGMAHAVNELTGKVFVVADPDTNALLVTTASKYEKQVRRIIEDLDRAVPQVLIKVLIAEVTHDDGTDVGAEFSILNLRANGQGAKGGVNFGLSKIAGGLVAQVVENNFTATIRALESVGKLDVLSRPYILASDNQLARITVGQEVPFIDSSRITETGQTVNTLDYKDVGILLDVIPHINSDGLVILDVAPEISALTGETIPVSDNAAQPIIAKRSAQTRVGIRDGQTIVIGGLMEDRKTQTIDKVPILGDIPLLGEVFKHHLDKKTKTELLIFLTPHVAQSPESLEASSQEEARGTKLVPRAVAPGVYEDHMDGLHRGQMPQTKPAKPTDPINSIDLSEPPKNGQPENVDPDSGGNSNQR